MSRAHVDVTKIYNNFIDNSQIKTSNYNDTTRPQLHSPSSNDTYTAQVVYQKRSDREWLMYFLVGKHCHDALSKVSIQCNMTNDDPLINSI